MTIPSYDDLTPGIPDEIDAMSASQLALFLPTTSAGTVREPPMAREGRPNDLNETTRAEAVHEPGWAAREPPLQEMTTLYACLRAANCELPTTNHELPTLLAIARDFSPRVMVASAREVLLDVSGLGRLIGEPPAIAAALARALFEAGVEASVALAPTQTAARLLATQAPLDEARGRPLDEAPFDSAQGRRERPSGPATHVAHLPVRLLQPLETLPPAMNHRDRARPYETLENWGIATLGDLVALPADELSSRLGRRGVALQRLARGLDPRPFVPDGETPRYIGRLELEWPLDTLEPLSFVFARLLEPLSAALERADRGAAAIRMDLRLTTRDTHARVVQLPAPMRDPKVLRTLLLLDLESPSSPLRGFPPSPANAGFGGTGGETSAVTAAVDIVTIELDPAPARITQFSLLERAWPSPETISTLTARLSALVGESRMGSAVLVDTHRPGAFEMARFAPDSRAISSRRSDEVASLDAARDALGLGRRAKADAVLRRQRIPPAIRVRIEHGRPVYLAAARRGMPQGAVTQAAGPWRTSGGWWAESDASRARGIGPGHATTAGPVSPPVPPKPALAGEGGKPRSGEGGWSRDEWDVALTSGAVCRIYQDRTTERWFLEGIYD